MSHIQPAIALRGAARSFGAREALRPMDLAIDRGEVFGLLGPNGSGKTTTLRILATLIRPTSGEAAILGHDVVNEAMRVRTLIGVMPEKPSLYERLTVRDNLRFWADAHGVAQPGVAVPAAVAFTGLGERVSERVGELSKGWRQRVALARAIVHRPPVLLLDEPSSGLDASAALAMEEMIRTLAAEGTTVLMNTHRLAEADRMCDRVAVLRDGVLLEVGTPGELRSRLLSNAIRVGLREPPTAAIRAVVESTGGVAGIRWDATGFHCQLADANRDTPALVATLVAAGAPILSVVPEGDLEEAYLRLMTEAPVALREAAA